MNANRRFNSIARRIQRSWHWKKLGQILILNLLAFATVLAAYLYVQETTVTGAFAGWKLPRALTMDVDRHTVVCDGQDVELTQREFALLQTLLENKGIVLGRGTLLERVWGYDYMGETNIVDVYVRYLRGKIDDVFGVKLVQTVRGVGYVIRES